MTIAIEWVALIVGGLSALGWLGVLAGTLHAKRKLHCLAEQPIDERDWPQVSVIRPACNEADHLEEATRQTLELDYPDLQVVLIDDRSTDTTSQIVDRLAEDERVVGLHITELPDGWLGKLNAMHQGVQHATGEWYLFADADSRFAAGTLQRAIAWADEAKLDFVSVMPGIERADFLADTAFSAANHFFGIGVKPWLVEQDDKTVAATGAFMLVRRVAFERTPGFEWMPLEVGDDFALCLMIKTFGGRAAMTVAPHSVRLPWYRTFREMTLSMQKNFFGILGRFSAARCLLQVGALLFMALGPFAPLLVSTPPAIAITCVAVGSGLANGVVIARWTDRPVVSALLPWLGLVLTAYIVVRAAIVGVRQGGIIWRGVLYPSEQLRLAQRLKL